MVDPGELRRGNVVRLDGTLYEIVEYQHQKIGRGGAQTKLRLRDIVNRTTTDRVFQASQRFERVRLDTDPAQFLYQSADAHHFMNMQTYDEVALSTGEVGVKKKCVVQISADKIATGFKIISVIPMIPSRQRADLDRVNDRSVRFLVRCRLSGISCQ